MEVGDDFLRWYRSTPDARPPFRATREGGGEGGVLYDFREGRKAPSQSPPVRCAGKGRSKN